MTNYVEYIQEQHSEDTREFPELGSVTYYNHEQIVWWAVRPNPDSYKIWSSSKTEPEDYTEYFSPGFAVLGGDKVIVYDKESLAGLRGLLDEIEKLL